jgi:hypothetical protein
LALFACVCPSLLDQQLNWRWFAAKDTLGHVSMHLKPEVAAEPEADCTLALLP